MRGVSSFVRFGGFLAVLGLALGCTHQDPADRSLEKLRADIAKIEADRDRLDLRVGALETAEQQRRELPASAASSSVPSRVSSDRKLPVVHVAEGETLSPPLPPLHGEAPDLDTNSGDLRPIVRAAGSRSSAASHRGSKDALADGIAFSPEAKRDYDSALALVKATDYEKALQAFTAFLVRYPDHPYAENAMYWRGECFYATGAYARAAEQFEGLIARFSYGNKAPDALLKLGLSQEKSGAKDQAQKTFAELKDRYPKSDAARQLPRP